MLFTIILSILTCVGGTIQITDENWSIVSDLKKEWVIYDNESGLYIPYMEDEHRNHKVVNLNLDLNKYKGCYFSLSSIFGASLFSDNSLVDYYPDGFRKNYSIDSITSITSNEQVFITLYLKEGNLLNINTRIVSNNPESTKSVYSDTFYPKPFNKVQYRDYLVVGLIIILFLYAVTISVDKRVFTIYIDFPAIFRRFSRDDYLLSQRTINNADILNINQLNAAGSFLLILMIIFRNESINLYAPDLSSDLLILWLGFFVLTTIWFVLKFLLIRLMTQLFQIKEIQNLHFYEYIRLNNIVVLLAFVLFQITYFAFDIPIVRLSLAGLIVYTIFIILRMVVLYFKFLNSTTHKKVYLFSYLCTTEIVPALISLKLLYSADQVVWF